MAWSLTSFLKNLVSLFYIYFTCLFPTHYTPCLYTFYYWNVFHLVHVVTPSYFWRLSKCFFQTFPLKPPFPQYEIKGSLLYPLIAPLCAFIMSLMISALFTCVSSPTGLWTHWVAGQIQLEFPQPSLLKWKPPP